MVLDLRGQGTHIANPLEGDFACPEGLWAYIKILIPAHSAELGGTSYIQRIAAKISSYLSLLFSALFDNSRPFLEAIAI